jgi:CRP-like cAMP-binding protein
VQANRTHDGNGRDPRLVEGVLSSLPFFRQVARCHVGTVASQARIQYARRGAAVCRHGEPMPGVIAVGYDIMKLALRGNEGSERVVRFLRASKTFGESAALLGRVSPVDIVALEDSMVAVVPPAPLLRLLELDPTFARNVVWSLGEGFLALLDGLQASSQQNSVQRFTVFLESLLSASSDAHGEATVRLPASKTVVAARLGITKETLSRLLRELAGQGLISVSGREIRVLDRAGLGQAGD